ncbi:CaiB/BaiF CoA transferase family protein [Humibacter ginsenosidimutans]|uniref:CoA transferase n=1 Tax=Humibacter ginsenosidimutans TaxID=2599293 RepID=A0A5B8M6Z9_9MICO|nr:CoA transferase [Humibacter ginsenosidimutans]QDZ16156.1 CoA transferase [Humibacter ginsenosidimutans]
MTETAKGDAGALPLAGIRVADFSRVLAGPYATMMLADFGADVIKIESPAGDDTRSWAPPRDEYGDSTYFASVNRNKRSMVCDLTTEVGLREARRLASSADIVIENFRPGVMERFGLDHDSVSASNPGVIYCSITGFGDGDGAALPGYDLLVQAVGGLMSVTGRPDGEPSKAGVALVDVITGLNAVSGVLLALRQRESTGRGTRVRVELMTSLLSALVNQASGTLATGVSPRRMGNAHPSIAPYEVFRAADRELVLAVGNDRQFAALERELGLDADPRLATNPRRVALRHELHDAIDSRLAERPASEWVERMNAAGIPAGLVNTVGEAIDFAASLGLDPTVTIDDGDRVGRFIADPVHLDGVTPAYDSLPPRLGADQSADWRDTSGPSSTTNEGTS